MKWKLANSLLQPQGTSARLCRRNWWRRWLRPSPRGSSAGSSRQGSAAVTSWSRSGLKDSVAERPNHSDLCTSEFAQKSVKIQENFSEFFRKCGNFKTSQLFLACSAKFRGRIIKIGAKVDENYRKTMIFCRHSNKNSNKVWRTFANILNLERCEGVWIF